MKEKISKVCMYLFIFIFISIIIMPFIWLVLGSFKNMKELFAIPAQILPTKLRIENFIDVFKTQPFGGYIINSLITSALATILIIVIGSMASYALARVEIKGKQFILAALLSITLLPPVTLLNPLYRLLSKFSLLNTWWGLALIITATELPMAIWFLNSFFQSVSKEMEESAMIDGANMRVQILKIIMPLVSPGVFTIAIMTFVNAWNNYLFAQVFNPLPKARNVTVALTLFQIDDYLPWNLISAASVIVTLPLIIVILILQKKIIGGMMEGGVKG
ncbi:MAG: carbohydrate ABC transporter permease [Ruminiclostridium sp.]